MNSVLLDTSFFIRLLNLDDPLHSNAKDYFKYFLAEGIEMRISTISIAEFCVRGDITDLPLKNLKILPFNYDHACKAGQFARIIFEKNKAQKNLDIHPRVLIPNDSKLFAQADTEVTIEAFVTSDERSKSTVQLLKDSGNARFDYIDISTPFGQTFGVLF
jgi:predicted nucleic acid-binding protein